MGIHNRQRANISLIDRKALSGKFGMRTILGSHSGALLMQLLVNNYSLNILELFSTAFKV